MRAAAMQAEAFAQGHTENQKGILPRQLRQAEM